MNILCEKRVRSAHETFAHAVGFWVAAAATASGLPPVCQREPACLAASVCEHETNSRFRSRHVDDGDACAQHTNCVVCVLVQCVVHYSPKRTR